MTAKNPEQSAMMNCAMNFCVVVGGYNIVKFCLFPLSLHSTMAALLFLGMTLVLPFLIFQLVKRYRDQYCGGRIVFSRALVFSVFTMVFGSLLVSVAHYIYFAFIENGAMAEALMRSIEQLQSVDLNALEGVDSDAMVQFDQYIEAVRQTASQLQAMSPIEMTIGMLSNNFSWSVVLSLPIALVVKKIN